MKNRRTEIILVAYLSAQCTVRSNNAAGTYEVSALFLDKKGNVGRIQPTGTILSVMLIWFAVVIVGPCSQVIADNTGKPESVLQSQHEPARMRQDAMMCGPNSLYLILRLYGIPFEPDAIKKRYIPSHPKGMSLLELRDACEAFGLKAQMRQCSVTQLCKNFRSPVIAYTTWYHGESRHYVVLLAVENDRVCLMDATTGRIIKTTPQKLENIWLGYILVPSLGGGNSMLALGISVLLWLIAAYAILRVLPRARLAPHRRESNRPLVRFGLFLLTLGVALTCWQSAAIGESADVRTSLGPEGGAQPIFWRLPENDGINCLYIQLRLLGYSGSYDTFLRQALDARSFQTMESLAILAKQAGFHLVPKKLTASELSNMACPVLVHIEDEGIGSGSFCLFLDSTERSALLINGSYVGLAEITLDRFKRAWTAYALVPQKTTDWLTLARRGGALLLISYIVLFILNAHKQETRLSIAGHLYERSG